VTPVCKKIKQHRHFVIGAMEIFPNGALPSPDPCLIKRKRKYSLPHHLFKRDLGRIKDFKEAALS